MYVPHGALPDRRGFAPAIVAWNLARHLRFAIPVAISAAEDYRKAFEVIDGITIHRLHQSKAYSRLFTKMTRLDPWPLHLRAAASARETGVELFHAHQLEFPVASFVARLPRRIPVVVHAHVTNRRFEPANGTAERYIAVSDHVRGRLVEQGYPEHAIEVVPNGVDTALFRPAAAEEKAALRVILGIPADARVLLFAGRKQAIKGFGLFLRVAAQLLNKYSDLYVVAAGSEPRDAMREADYADRQAMRARLVENPRYLELPALPQARLANLFRVADVSLLPSATETQGMVMLESMAAGCLTVSTRVGGVPESVAHGETGWLIGRPDDLEEALHLTEAALADLPNNEPIRAAARLRMEQRFAWPVVAARMERIYFELAGRGGMR